MLTRLGISHLRQNIDFSVSDFLERDQGEMIDVHDWRPVVLYPELVRECLSLASRKTVARTESQRHYC